MTKQHRAGRELDALVAEKVFGCNVYRSELAKADGPRAVGTVAALIYEQYFRCRCPVNGLEDVGPHAGHFLGGLKHYSTDIAAAWEVWEHVGREYCIRLIKLLDKGAWIWQAEVNGYCWAQGNTAPEAICLCALKFVGAE